jgi:hypothetical protein
MPEEYTNLVTALKALTQGTVALPMAEDEWATRPDTVSYGIVQLDFEADALHGDDRKQCVAYEGSVDLFSLQRSGAGWVELITGTLEEHCDGCWRLESFQYENETGLFHWEWVFQVEG